jgi:hypothetical protein
MVHLSDQSSPWEELGLSERKFVEHPAPYPPDEKKLRAYLAGELPEEDAKDVDHLIAHFREWHEAFGPILKEHAKEVGRKYKESDL